MQFSESNISEARNSTWMGLGVTIPNKTALYDSLRPFFAKFCKNEICSIKVLAKPKKKYKMFKKLDLDTNLHCIQYRGIFMAPQTTQHIR